MTAKDPVISSKLKSELKLTGPKKDSASIKLLTLSALLHKTVAKSDINSSNSYTTCELGGSQTCKTELDHNIFNHIKLHKKFS